MTWSIVTNFFTAPKVNFNRLIAGQHGVNFIINHRKKHRTCDSLVAPLRWPWVSESEHLKNIDLAEFTLRMVNCEEVAMKPNHGDFKILIVCLALEAVLKSFNNIFTCGYYRSAERLSRMPCCTSRPFSPHQEHTRSHSPTSQARLFGYWPSW